MQRITEKLNNGTYQVAKSTVQETVTGYQGAAIDKLALFEDSIEGLLKQNEKLTIELERLREEGKEKTYKYKETMASRLTNIMIMDTLDFFQKSEGKKE